MFAIDVDPGCKADQTVDEEEGKGEECDGGGVGEEGAEASVRLVADGGGEDIEGAVAEGC